MEKQHYEIVSIDQLKTHPKNARRGDLGAIYESIQQNGFFGAVYAQKSSGMILVGNHRYLAAKQAGHKEIPVIWLDVDDDRALRILLVDNRTNDLASYNEELLAELLQDLERHSDLKLEGTGFDQDALDELLKQIGNDVLESEEEFGVDVDGIKTDIHLGDLFTLGKHRLLCGDASKKEDVQKLMGGTKADMVFTDPPYGVSYEKKSNEILGNGRQSSKIQNDDISLKELQPLIKNAFINIASILNNTGCYYICSPQGGELGLMMMQESGIACRHCLIWVKNNPVFSMGRLDYDYQHEPILYGWAKTHKFYGNGQHTKSVWSIDRPNQSKLHPTMKPVELVKNAILNSTIHDMIVVDLFGGSGTTLIAAEETGRVAYLSEIDPVYCQVIIDRWELFTGKKAEKIHE